MRSYFLAGLFAATAVSATPAAAISINDLSWDLAGCVGAAACTIDGVDLTAQPGGSTFTEQNDGAGVIGLGVNSTGDDGSGSPGNEIQGRFGEMMSLDFGAGASITDFSIAFFFNPDEFPGSNEPEEVAIFEFTFTDNTTTSISVLNSTNAGDGFEITDDDFATSVQSSGDSAEIVGSIRATRTSTDAGIFEFDNLFGTAVVSSLVLKTADDLVDGTTEGSDYALLTLNADPAVTVVPVPAALPLLLGGLAGLGIVGRRRKA
ncbi:MAG: VPLPA-CTERM sorting domain-containing protein [Pseudomonadota bacterium]